VRARRRKPGLWVDLTSVTFIDAAGKAFLAHMRRSDIWISGTQESVKKFQSGK
jgi:anti-anti-sigma regulatory factor